MTSGKPSARFRGKRNGTGNGNAKLTDDEAWEIRRAREGAGRRLNSDPRSTHALAVRFGITPSQVSKVALGQQWAHHLGQPDDI